MEKHEYEAVLTAYKVLSSKQELSSELRMYITGMLEQLLRRYYVEPAEEHVPSGWGTRLLKRLWID